MILFINTCVRPQSRTLRLANEVIKRISNGKEIHEVKPSNLPLTNDALNLRTDLIEKKDFSSKIFDDARIFAAADEIVIAAPYWDLSFPSWLKTYIEAININGLTFAYTEDGRPYGMCKAKRLIYVTTAGGPIISDYYGYGYVKDLARLFWGIPEIRYVKAEGLDIIGADVEGILTETIKSLHCLTNLV